MKSSGPDKGSFSDDCILACCDERTLLVFVIREKRVLVVTCSDPEGVKQQVMSGRLEIFPDGPDSREALRQLVEMVSVSGRAIEITVARSARSGIPTLSGVEVKGLDEFIPNNIIAMNATLCCGSFGKNQVLTGAPNCADCASCTAGLCAG